MRLCSNFIFGEQAAAAREEQLRDRDRSIFIPPVKQLMTVSFVNHLMTGIL